MYITIFTSKKEIKRTKQPKEKKRNKSHKRNRIPHEERYFLCCNNLDTEDEFHFICIYQSYDVIKYKYLKNYYYRHPSCINLFNF